MKLHIERAHFEALAEDFPRLEVLRDQLRFGNRVEVSSETLGGAELGRLCDLYRAAGPAMQGCAAQVAALQRAANEGGESFEAGQLEALVPVLARYLVADGIRGWLFRANRFGRPMPYVVTRLDYTPAGEEESARLLVELKANSRGRLDTETIVIREKDLGGHTPGRILAAKGYLKETPELIAAYDASAARYFDWRTRCGEQFSGRGTGYYAEDPAATHRSRDYSRKDVVVLSADGGPARLVNDESLLDQRVLTLDVSGDILGKYLRKAAKSARYDSRVENQVEASQEEIPAGMFTDLPVHGYIFLFHLELHHHLWVHVDDLTPYAYRPALKQKLILPKEQTDLIDILTAEMDVLMDDIVEGKSGGTTVLCAGPPGVGKTLTAEVYAEIIQRPLYRVHSGQLGLNVGEMEKALRETLIRAQRWGAVMLIDEADVYIKRRDDDIAANAVVGVFLRVLEYFNGLLFLTTNRVDDIDEAIVSRCIALIRYHPPGREDRRRIWSVMTEQFNLKVDGQLIERLVDAFPTATGRDIKGLTKLVAKFCQHKGVPPGFEVFARCSVFRGMDLEASAMGAEA